MQVVWPSRRHQEMLDSSFKKSFLKFLNMDTQKNQLKGLENIRKTMPNYEVVFGEDTNT